MTPDVSKEFFSCLALRHTPGIGPRTWKTVLGAYGSAYAAVADARNWAARKLIPKNRAELFLSEPWRAEAEAEYRAVRASDPSRGVRVITWFDPRYPERLREIPDPPVLLYAVGDVSLLANPAVAVVGARECTSLGLASVERISADLSRHGVTVVSGLALGIDRQAHLAALSGVGGTIAVLGAGLDIHYPPENEDVRRALERRGLVLTEYGPGTRPEARNFPVRNRIISGLSLGVLVAEAAARSGSLITARLAAEQGREVFALPGPLGEPTFTGCHRLIKQGAALVESAEDIISTLRFLFSAELAKVPKMPPEDGGATPVRQPAPDRPGKTRSKKIKDSRKEEQLELSPTASAGTDPLPDGLDEEERQLLERLTRTDKAHIDSLIQALGWDSPKVSRRLVILEVRGLVRQWPGMYYSRA